MSRTHCASIRSSAHVSEQTTVGIAQPAEGQRPESVRIANGDQPILRQEHEGERALRLQDRLDERLFHARRPRPRVEVQQHLGVARGLEDRTLRRPASSRSSWALTRLPLWPIAISPCAQSIRIGCAFLTPLSPAVEYRTWPIALVPRQPCEAWLRRSCRPHSPWPCGPAVGRRRRTRFRRSPGRDAVRRTARGTSDWPPRCARRSPKMPHSSLSLSIALGS